MGCRICFDDCTTALPCGCVGYAHFTCLEAWINTRLARGDRLEDALHCEVCTGKYLGARERKCSFKNVRVVTSRVCVGASIGVLACTIIACILQWTEDLHVTPPTLNILMMTGVWGFIVGIAFCALSLIIRLVSIDCINACAVHDVYIESVV